MTITERRAQRIEQWPVERLKPYARNARTHSPAQVGQIAESIKRFGFNNPILVDSADGIIAGHGRFAGAQKLGLRSVPVIVLDHLTDAERRAYILADNRIAENAAWDNDMLTAELAALNDEEFDLGLLGFTDRELEQMLAVDDGGRADECPEVPDTAITRTGDLWVLGRHRVLCGDATSAEDVARLMGSAKADMVFTDPPYGIDEETDRQFASRTRLAKGGKFAKIIGDTSTLTACDALALCSRLDVPVQIFWGANHYAHAVPETASWIVWDKRCEDKQRDMNSDAELAWVQADTKSVRVFRHLWKGLIKESEHGQARVHPTQKPVALACWCFDEYGSDARVVLDLFLGSGSTLIACEKTNRACFGTEMSTAYCDVIVTRWQEYTSQAATLDGDGRTFAAISAERREA